MVKQTKVKQDDKQGHNRERSEQYLLQNDKQNYKMKYMRKLKNF